MKSCRFMYARNWDDFLQRDLKAYTFPRAFGLFSLSSMALYTSLSWFTRLLPVGRFGIRKISQTSFYHNFGSLGVVGAVGMLFSAAYIEWKTFKFTIHKFYHHIILQERNWLLQQDKEPGYGQYYFKDNPLSADENFPHEARAEMAKKQRKTASLSLDKN